MGDTRTLEHCDECGFDAGVWSLADSIEALKAMGPRWRAALAPLDDGTLRRRPEPEVWSALEYTAHTRDVMAGNGYLLHKTLQGEGVSIPAISADDAAAASDYNTLAPADVLDDLEANAGRIAGRAERASPADWTQRIRVERDEVLASLVDQGIIDALGVLRHAVHEAVHHLDDVQRNLAAMTRHPEGR